jgi:hypothetical protein
MFHSQHRQSRLMTLNLQGLTEVEQSSCMNNQLSYRTSQDKRKGDCFFLQHSDVEATAMLHINVSTIYDMV